MSRVRWLALLLLLSAAGAHAGGTDAAPPDAAALYERLECAGCHERAALPGMTVRPLAGLSERYDAETLTVFLAAPPEPMPVPALSDAERRALAALLLQRFP